MPGGMGIMTIRAFNMTRGVYRIFHGIVYAGGGGNRMNAGFVEFGLDICGGNISVMTRIAVLLFFSKIKQALA